MGWVDYLWQGPQPASEAEIAAAEAALGLRFPADYRAALAQHQGQRPQPGLFDIPRQGSSAMGPLFHLRAPQPGVPHPGYHLLQVLRSRRHLLPPGLLPISEDAAGNLIALDYRRSKARPALVYVDHERLGRRGAVTRLAASFGELLARLHEDEG